MSEFNVAQGTLFICRDVLHDNISMLFIGYKALFSTNYMLFLRTYKVNNSIHYGIETYGHPTHWRGLWYALEPNSSDLITDIKHAFKI